jgi:hypothetical protein
MGLFSRDKKPAGNSGSGAPPLNELMMGAAMMLLTATPGNALPALMTCSLDVDGEALRLHAPAAIADRLVDPSGQLIEAVTDAAQKHGVAAPQITVIRF